MRVRRPNFPDEDRVGRGQKDLHDQAARTHTRRSREKFMQAS